jgi:hypothetical protein
MELSSVASPEAKTIAALGGRFSVLEMEHSRVELERREESSSKCDGSTDLKISVKWCELAPEYRALCRT